LTTRASSSQLDISTLESWLWEAACKIRGPIDAPKYKDYILPLIFLKRLSNVFADEVAALGTEYGDPDVAQELVEADHSLVRFYIPPKSRWTYLAQLSTIGLGESLTDAVRGVSRENPRLAGVIDVTDFNATTAGQRIISDEHLHELVQVLNQHRLGLHDVEPDILGRAYEYLLRKFADELSGNYKFVVMDNEAGMEHLSRRTTQNIDLLLIVSDHSVKGVRTVARIKDLSDELKLVVGSEKIIVNSVDGELAPRVKEEMDNLGLESPMIIPDDEKIYQFDLEARPLVELPDDSKAVMAVDALMEEILSSEKLKERV